MDKEEKLLLTIDDVAKALSLAHSTTRAMLSAGEIDSVKIGKRRLVPAVALARYVDALMAQQGVATQTQAVR